MTIDKGQIFGDLTTGRHERDTKHITEYRDKKANELGTTKEHRGKIH